ncbi:MAG: hypothetical protein JSW39_30145 [Desulfobacterales bacterium]|nr:MAG: hypothetical protein JSW39_30145 [Desulfobacterales bacterium]
MVKSARRAMQSGQQNTQFLGSIWGIFWKQRQNLLISRPVSDKEHTIAGISIAWPLDSVFGTLRHLQGILFIYVLINAALLTICGMYRLSKIYLQPISRLAERADRYREDTEMLFAVRRGDNELNNLSRALNGMVRRIAADKEKLRETVASLEKANFELKQAQKDVVRAEKLASVGRLSAGIAHEIGNPIGIVHGYLELLKQEDITPGEHMEYVTRTENEVTRINMIIRQLLDLSRSSHSGLELISVHEIVNDVRNVFRLQPLMCNIVLELELQADQDIVLADPNQLRQVFLNLMINAADAIASCENKTTGRITIKSRVIFEENEEVDRKARQLEIQFIDNGPGIPEGNLGNIFDPFYTTKEPGKGTGLGLSVSYMIVEGIGGTMKVQSEVGKGTSMILCLPLAVEGHPAA